MRRGLTTSTRRGWPGAVAAASQRMTLPLRRRHNLVFSGLRRFKKSPILLVL